MTAVRIALSQPTRTGTAIAAGVRDGWLADDRAAEVATPDSPPRGRVEHLLAVVPVLGDERMPDVMEACLARWAGRSRTHRVCLTGDFRTGQRSSPVADEADRLLVAGGSVPTGPPVLVDTPADPAALRPVLAEFIAAGSAAAPDAAATVPEPPARRRPPEVGEAALRRLLSLLPDTPRMSFDADGRCVSLVLLDSAPYPRSLLLQLAPDVVAEVLELATALPALRAFGLPFARLTELPVALPSGLATVDLRGNPLARWDPIADLPSLTALNLAGCDLADVPPQVETLTGLRTLVLAKNRIVGGLAPLALPELRRLTLYRNQLSDLDLPFGRLQELRLLNVGANPLPEVPPGAAALTATEVVGLRMLPLPRFPAVLASLPELRQVDLSKTPWAGSDVPGRPDVRSTDGMPRWAWDDEGVSSGVRA